jgi:Ca-activated chloride channel family protein
MSLPAVTLLGLLTAVIAHTSASQQPAPAAPPRVEILSPRDNAFVSGETGLRARIEPSSSVLGITFFVDGRPVCARAAEPFECEWDAGPDIAAHQVRLVVDLADGGRIARTVRTRGLGYAETVDVDAVQVTVTVTDTQGKYVSGIPRKAFRIFEDSKPQQVGNFSSEDVPLELVVAVDISGSMAPAMPKLKTAVKEFLRAVPSRDQVTLLGFNDNVFALTRGATDPEERVRAVDRLAPWGATALYDVIARGIGMLGRQAGRRALIVFTDGEDQGSHVSLDDVERRLQASDVTLYMIGQGRGTTHDYLKNVMERLVTPTGGRAFSTDSIDALRLAFGDLLEELSHQYLLGYQSTNARRDEEWRQIRVEVDGYSGVRARQGYRAVSRR